jgi:hexosaminidase
LFGANGGPTIGEMRADSSQPKPIVYVWNNVWGWGREDAAYRLANAGYDIVLANATNLYFDLAQEKDPEEPGYYWAAFVGMRDPYEFNPLDVFQNVSHDSMGHAMSPDQFRNRVRLTDEGRRHILGIQGELWGENLRDPKRLEYMAFPRTIALAERAWAASPAWTAIEDRIARGEERGRDWNRFANCLGQRELVRLGDLAGGVSYRVPPPGAVIHDRHVIANVAYPGLEIRYTIDGTEPTAGSPRYQEPLALDKNLRLRSFDIRGNGSRTTMISPKLQQ